MKKILNEKIRSKIKTSLAMILSFILGAVSFSYAEGTIPTWSSRGIVDFIGDGSVVFNASDLNTIYNETTSGRAVISQALLDKNPTWSTENPTPLHTDGTDNYTTLAQAIQNQTIIPTHSDGTPAIPELKFAYTFYDSEGQLKYEENNVEPTGILTQPLQTPLTVNGVEIVSSDDLAKGKFAFDQYGKMAVGSGKAEEAAIEAASDSIRASVWDDLREGLGFYTKDGDNFVKGDTKRTTLYDAVDSIDALDQAIAEDNKNYYEEGYANGSIQSAASGSLNIRYSMDIRLSGSVSYHNYSNDDNEEVRTDFQGASGTAATLSLDGNLSKITLSGVSAGSRSTCTGRSGMGWSGVNSSYTLTLVGDGRTLFNSSSWSSGTTVDITGVNTLSYNFRPTNYSNYYGGDDFRNNDWYASNSGSMTMTLSNY